MSDLERLPEPLRTLETAPSYPVIVSEALKNLATKVDELQDLPWIRIEKQHPRQGVSRCPLRKGEGALCDSKTENMPRTCSLNE